MIDKVVAIPVAIQRQIERIAEVCERRKPLVVISCITYNHEPFLRDALEGFVMQQTDFPYVAIVHDDASTDGTANVLREYAERYPDIILPIYEEENLFSKRNGSLRRVMTAACAVTGAKYIALCEGDDYWTFPHKLQRQVDFLEAHSDYSLVFHNAPFRELDGSYKYRQYAIIGTRDYSPSEMIRKWTIPTASVVYRRENIDVDPVRANSKFKFGDNVLFLTAAKYGKLYGIDEYWSVYRRHLGGMILLNGPEWPEIVIEHTKELSIVFGELLEKNLCVEINSEKYIYLLKINKNNPRRILSLTARALRDCGFTFVKRAFKGFVFRVNKCWRGLSD